MRSCVLFLYVLILVSGNRRDTRGTAFVVYEDIYDAKNAREHLSGFNVKDRYLIVLYHSTQAAETRRSAVQMQQNIEQLQSQIDK